MTIPQITSLQAQQMLLDDDSAVLIDVRTEGEWRSVGVPSSDSIGRRPRYVSWTDETGQRNPSFIEQATEGVTPDTPILLLCRSGGRSQAAALLLTECGYTGAHNIIGGFEGAPGAGGLHSGGWQDQIGGAEWKPGD